ncbi:MAG: FtsX-like permease family protein [Hyphomicrobiales bacterium]|nr:FtsX-like permease family protein [Hyphomicrobiales bacterium]
MSTTRARLAAAVRLAGRELRGALRRSLRGFGVFVACLALGVAAIAGVGALGRAFEATLAAEGDAILGGDLAFAVNHRPLEPAQKAHLAAFGRTSEIATLRAMARTVDGDRTALVEAKAVDAAYPLVGRLALADGTDGRAALREGGGAVLPALVEETLLDRLGIAVGDEIAFGAARLRVAGVIGVEPDRLAGGVGFGPRLIVSLETLGASGLLAPGSLVRWHERLKLDGPSDEGRLERITAEARAAFPEAGWQIRSRADAAPGTRSTIERFVQFLTLVGFTTLVIGGVGVANAVTGHLERRRRTIAIWRSLGATRAQILIVHGLEIGAIALIGIGLGLVVGAVAPHLLAGPIGAALGVPLRPVAAPGDWALAALEGFLTAALFAWMPLARALEASPAVLFRDEDEPATTRRRLPPGVVVTAAIGAALVLLVVATAPDRRITPPYLAVLAVALVGLRLLAGGLVAGLRRAPRPRLFEVRAAVAAMVRPRAATAAILASIGLGATLITALTQVEQGLLGAIERTLPGAAPSFFFLDVPAREAEAFRVFLGDTAVGARIEDVPMLRGRITRLKGVPVEQAVIDDKVRFILDGDRGVTYSAEPPPHSTVVEGAWWPADHAGPPLVSFDAETAKGMGLSVGDTVAVNVLGREIEARVANFRKIEWDRLAINFFMVFSPDAFRGAPATRLATVTWPNGGGEAQERALLRAVVDRFPVVTAVRVKDALTQVDALVRRSAAGISAVAAFALAAATLVLGGSLAAQGETRIRNAAILAALGATRRRLIAALALEFALLGLVGGGFGALLGTFAARHVLTNVMHLSFSPDWRALLVTLFATLAATVALGLLATRAALSARPSEILRAGG